MCKSSHQRISHKKQGSRSTVHVLNCFHRKKDVESANEEHSGVIPVMDMSREDHSLAQEVASKIAINKSIGDLVPSHLFHSNSNGRQQSRNTQKVRTIHHSTRGSDYTRWHDCDVFHTSEYTGSNMAMERRGGLTWIKSFNGVLVPYIENTWLKHMITTLLPDTKALMKFLKTLQTCLEDAVFFLYKEGIKPYLGDVANQMKRSIADNFWSTSEVAFVSLHCRESVDLKIELRVKGEMGWVVYLRESPPGFLGFVDTHSTIDCYSNYHWRALNQFAVDIMTYKNSTRNKGTQKKECSLAFNGGRYAFAERLREKVYAFNSMRLGEVVHLVQLAIYSGVFVYAQRILLPVTACEKTAEEMFPSLKKVKHPVCSSLDEVRHIVSLLVDNRKNGLVLAQLKQQFMMQFNKELNPITFGFRKLQNLLLSEYFSHRYQLFVPIDSPHRTHIQHRKYPIPTGCRVFQQYTVLFDPNKFWSPLEEWYDEPPSSLMMDDLPRNIRSAIVDILESESDSDTSGRKCRNSQRDDLSTDATASSCPTARCVPYERTVLLVPKDPHPSRLNGVKTRSASV